ncbi:hypothetical protein AMS68_004154 [Peltaster fructicola]|uniref:C4-dicarboxylate transporter/malic acid transport protein n=1 Tax=Peltaster fructicola TaxID=286661 RepID=A0A6H0XV54_9PEZI|nr:hypothetical protein AMS68_004154 [Peltaster fructicola]
MVHHRRSPNGSKQHDHEKDDESHVTIGTRLSHLTFANFTLPMSTGGLGLLLHSAPYQFRGLETIGKIVFIFDLVIFVALCFGITYRFVSRPGSLRLALTHPTESLFFPTFLLAFVNILNCVTVYGVPSCGIWLVVTLQVLFWIYVAMCLSTVIFQYWYLFTAGQKLTIQSMTPAWILPALSAMLTGTLASLICESQPNRDRMPILVAGLTLQGFGFLVALLMYALFISRMMQYGLPAPNLRPGMMIAVGPPGFTSLALIQLSNNIPEDYGYFAKHPQAVEILQVMALFCAIFIWTIAFWFFCIALISILAAVKKMSFSLIYWALVFPNVGFTIATIDIGTALDSPGILWVATAMTIVIVCVWITVFVLQVVAICRKEIMMPGKDEDKDEYKEEDEKHGIHTYD